MSQARVHYVKAARQRYERVRTGEATPVISRRSGEQKTSSRGRPITRRASKADTSKPLPNHTCGKCGDEIKVGQPYRHFTVGFRGFTRFRCTKQECTPKPSELESSEHVANILAALEDAEDNLRSASFDDASEAESALQEEAENVASAVEEAASAYREADEAFGGTGTTQHAERADALDSAVYEFQSVQADIRDPEGCGDAFRDDDTDEDAPDHDEPEDGCAECDTKLEEWRDETRDAMITALTDVDLGV